LWTSGETEIPKAVDGYGGWIVEATEEEIKVRSQAIMQYNEETMNQYRQRRLSGKVVALMQALQRQGQWDPQEPEKLESPVHWTDLQKLASYFRRKGDGF
jgi:hypothetical protein